MFLLRPCCWVLVSWVNCSNTSECFFSLIFGLWFLMAIYILLGGFVGSVGSDIVIVILFLLYTRVLSSRLVMVWVRRCLLVWMNSFLAVGVMIIGASCTLETFMVWWTNLLVNMFFRWRCMVLVSNWLIFSRFLTRFWKRDMLVDSRLSAVMVCLGMSSRWVFMISIEVDSVMSGERSLCDMLDVKRVSRLMRCWSAVVMLLNVLLRVFRFVLLLGLRWVLRCLLVMALAVLVVSVNGWMAWLVVYCLSSMLSDVVMVEVFSSEKPMLCSTWLVLLSLVISK